MNTSKLLTAAEVADYLGVSQNALWQWRQSGYGPKFVKLGRGGPRSPVRYKAADVEAWVAQQTRCSTSDPGGLVA